MTTVEDQLKNRANFLNPDRKLYLVRCVHCGKENYALSVASGVCAWCGWNREDLLTGAGKEIDHIAGADKPQI